MRLQRSLVGSQSEVVLVCVYVCNEFTSEVYEFYIVIYAPHCHAPLHKDDKKVGR